MNKEQTGILKAVWESAIRKSILVLRKKKKRLFVPMSVAHVDDDEEALAPGEVYLSERVLPNGDFYTGQWLDGLPHGHGKYLWADGCMYVGEWSSGNMLGTGMFTWPSGATFEGDFKAGFMDGSGTFTGPSGDTYKGSWHMNLKHGHGSKLYPDGDHYDGHWRLGLQHGHGRYQWPSGTRYTGHWKSGAISGSGSMSWANGNSYEGEWEDGVPRGEGTFRWADGSSYEGVWSQDPEEMSGTYTPSEEWPERDPHKVYTADLKDLHISTGEKICVFPSEKGLMIEAVKARRVSVDSTESEEGSDGSSGMGLEDVKPRHIKLLAPMRKQGQTISKGHKNYELMLNLQLGIRHSVGRPAPATSLDLKPSAFDPREKVWTKFPPEGSKHTPPHQSSDFRWKDYCPVVFRTLRKLFKVDAADYMISLCGNDALRELSSPGKSGSFFYLTNDDKYMIKTMKKSETKVLIRMLPAYYNHVRAFENTLVTKFFGLHCVKLTGPSQKKVRFVIMGNLFCSEYSIHRRFDLKGSSHGRTTDKPESEIDATTTLKDLDLNYIFRLQKFWYQEFIRQVDRDCDFLEQERIMDYSLLIGLHFRENASYRESLTLTRTSAVRSPTSGCQTPTRNGELDTEAAPPRLSRIEVDKLLSNPARWASIRLGINMPTRVERTVRPKDCETQLIGEPTGDLHDTVLFFGIIDILQDYDISKKLEHAYKSIHYDPTSISAVDPKQYSKRFRDFIFKVFVEDT